MPIYNPDMQALMISWKTIRRVDRAIHGLSSLGNSGWLSLKPKHPFVYHFQKALVIPCHLLGLLLFLVLLLYSLYHLPDQKPGFLPPDHAVLSFWYLPGLFQFLRAHTTVLKNKKVFHLCLPGFYRGIHRCLCGCIDQAILCTSGFPAVSQDSFF